MKKVLQILISVIVLVTNVIAASAAENVLRGVDVKSGANSYTIELTATEPAKMSKTIISANRILVTLDGIKASNNIDTKYDKNAVIDNIIVESMGENSVSIMLQGSNIAYSDITFKSPTSLKNLENNVLDTVSAFTSLNNFSKNKTIPCTLLLVLGGILIAELRFIKSKYQELNIEKSLMKTDMERTSEFKEHLSGYGNQGLNKPYTTPIYSNPKNTSAVRANYLERLQKLQTAETVTLNSLLSNNHQEKDIINKIVNNKPVFGSLSNILTERKDTTERLTRSPMTSPVSQAKLKSELAHLETLSKLYQQSAESEETLHKRLNGLY